MAKKTNKKPSYRSEHMATVTSREEQDLQFLGSVVQATKISMGSQLENYVRELLEESKRFATVTPRHKIDVSAAGGRKTHVIDLVVFKHDGAIICFNCKSRTRSNTEDFNLTVKLYVSARDAMKKKYGNDNVSYQFLRIGGEPTPGYSEQGITTVDMDEFLSDLLGRPISVERELADVRKLQYLRCSDKLCKELGWLRSRGRELLKKFGIS